jgi:hypothetical protein
VLASGEPGGRGPRYVSELVTYGAERIVAILGVLALVMSMVVTLAAIPDERNPVPRQASLRSPPLHSRRRGRAG